MFVSGPVIFFATVQDQMFICPINMGLIISCWIMLGGGGHKTCLHQQST